MNSDRLKLMLRKVQITFLMLLSFTIIVMGGYNCAQKISYPPSVPIAVVPDNQLASEPADPYAGRLPEKPLDNRCNRSQYSDLEKRYGASAFVRVDAGDFIDFRLGLDTNFDVNCKRMYLDMTEKSRSYKGELTISYEENNQIKVETFKTGYNKEENKYNEWDGRDKTASSSGKLDSKFYAIFENSFAAIILQMDKVKLIDDRDGEQRMVGSGKIWYKMFRAFANDYDVCYRSGTYISKSKRSGRRPNTRCWFLNAGPHSCKPEGVNSGVIDLKDRDYECYDKLGTFGNLNVREAFNVGDDEFPY